MGRTGANSSKRKSSSSVLKKKRRSLERSKKKSKLRSRKSKKAHGPDDSNANLDDGSSYSSYSSSSYDSLVSRSGSDIKRRRSRSRSRKDRKHRSGRRRSLTSDSDESLECVRKRKRSRKSRDIRNKRTKISKKKRKREPSISSRSRSRSCSTCKSSEDSDCDTGKIEKLLPALGDRMDHDEFRARSNSKGMSRSCSPGSKDDGFSQSMETNSRRLRSVIVFTRRSDEEVEGRFEDDGEHKDEIMYDHDGYPSSKSNDSNDEESRREVIQETNGVSRKIVSVECLSSKTLPHAHYSSQKESLYGAQPDINPSTGLKAEMDSSLKGNAIESHAVEVASSNTEDLETILRQRALENLKKFRGASRPSLNKPALVKGDCGAKSKILSASSIESKENSKPSAIGHYSGKDPDDVGQSKELLNVISDTSAGEKEVHVSSPDAERVDIYSSREHQTNAAKGNDTIDISSGKPRQDSLPSRKNLLLQKQRSGVSSTSISAVSKGISEKLHSVSNDTIVRDSTPETADAPPLDPINYKGTSVEVFQSRSSKLDKHLGVAHNSSVPETLKSQGTEKHDEKSSQTDQLNRIADDVEKSKSTVCTSENHNVEGQSSNQKENENNDSSQFQQKTMSVMRGGEMVQVSYKVYIPKKAPALARRKLRR